MNKIIKGKYLIDGNGNKPKENSAVIIENGKKLNYPKKIK